MTWQFLERHLQGILREHVLHEGMMEVDKLDANLPLVAFTDQNVVIDFASQERREIWKDKRIR